MGKIKNLCIILMVKLTGNSNFEDQEEDGNYNIHVILGR